MSGSAHVPAPASFGSVTGLLIAEFGGFGGQRLEEQYRFVNHLLAQTPVGRLVVPEKRQELAACHRMALDGGHQCLGVLGVGARQRHQHPTGTPTREFARAHGPGGQLGQRFDQRQASGNPTRMPAHGRSDLVLAEPVGDL